MGAYPESDHIHASAPSPNRGRPRGATAADSREGRRLFLKRAAAAGGLGLGLAGPTESLARKAGGKSPRAGGGNARPPHLVAAIHPFTVSLFREIQADEDAHVPILQALLFNDPDNPFLKAGVFPNGVRPKPVLNVANLIQPDLPAFVAQAAAFENRGSGTYGGALYAIQQTPEYFQKAVGLCTVESRHASWLNSLLGQPLLLPGGAFGDHDEAPISQASTLAAIAPFVSQLPGPTPMFSPTLPSDPAAANENNFRVLDFLLVLEYIESTYYDLNVKKFFGESGDDD